MLWKKRSLRFGVGILLALAVLFALAETYLYWFPPKDLHQFLGDRSPLSGNYKPDREFALTYANWASFERDNAQRLATFLPLMQSRNFPAIWAFFGNSFVHAPGMLADHARLKMKHKIIFNLGRNEPIPLRFAQIEMLLKKGIKPERIIMSFMPVDTSTIGWFPLDTVEVNSHGALTYRPNIPDGPLGWGIEHSRLALTAWVRSNMHRGNRNYDFRDRFCDVDPVLYKDLKRLFSNLTAITHKHEVPVTVILIPEYEQVVRGRGFGFQDEMTRMLSALGYDVLDPRDAFCSHPTPAALYLPDWHLSPAGNRLLLDLLLEHVAKSQSTSSPGNKEASRP